MPIFPSPFQTAKVFDQNTQTLLSWTTYYIFAEQKKLVCV